MGFLTAVDSKALPFIITNKYLLLLFIYCSIKIEFVVAMEYDTEKFKI